MLLAIYSFLNPTHVYYPGRLELEIGYLYGITTGQWDYEDSESPFLRIWVGLDTCRRIGAECGACWHCALALCADPRLVGFVKPPHRQGRYIPPVWSGDSFALPRPFFDVA